MLLVRAFLLQAFDGTVRALDAHVVQHLLHVGPEALQLFLAQGGLLLYLALRQTDVSFFTGQLVDPLNFFRVHRAFASCLFWKGCRP